VKIKQIVTKLVGVGVGTLQVMASLLPPMNPALMVIVLLKIVLVIIAVKKLLIPQ
jgi:hypothetical protein